MFLFRNFKHCVTSQTTGICETVLQIRNVMMPNTERIKVTSAYVPSEDHHSSLKLAFFLQGLGSYSFDSLIKNNENMKKISISCARILHELASKPQCREYELQNLTDLGFNLASPTIILGPLAPYINSLRLRFLVCKMKAPHQL